MLAMLQKDCTVSVADLAAHVNLSATPCWRRLQRLEKEGYIGQRVALLDAVKMNVGVTVFVEIKTAQHSAAWLKRFSAALLDIPEIVEVHRMSGHIDYLLKVVVPDIAAYDGVYKQLITAVELFDVSSGFSMECLKSTTALPLDYAE
jgi:Lrp/AsnC family transcriptional regulator